jgi:two-component system chemotaxis response regulator CheB
MTDHPIKVLIVEDSPIAAKLLEFIINSDPALKVIGCVDSGEEALNFIKGKKPDVITMDIVLPKMDGFETTEQIMQTTPIPIIIVSANYKKEDVDKSFKAISVGAVDILEKPVGPRDPVFHAMAAMLIQSIKNAAKIKLITRSPYAPLTHLSRAKVNAKTISSLKGTKAIAIGASLGGPKALNYILSQLPAEFPLPILVVQHISPGFTPGLVDWLNESSHLTIKLAQNREIIKPGYVYIAPDNYHLEVNSYHMIYLNDDPPENGLRPSVGRLFRSMAYIYKSAGLGIILTGMGHDGAKELLLMKNYGALTIAQDQKSSFVFGMPKAAIALGAATCILSIDEIVVFLQSLVIPK